MTELYTPADVYAALVSKGTTPVRAREIVAAKFGAPKTTMVVVDANEPAVTSGLMRVVGPQLDFPIRFELPWTALISENRRFLARGNRIFMTEDYKAARAKATAIARAAMTVDGTVFQPLAMPLCLTARVYVPDRRVHDVPNFAGAVHNALKKIVYVDDAWIYEARWIRVGVFQDRPRADIEIAPL